jgi:tyrosyl-tRNA synthetase
MKFQPKSNFLSVMLERGFIKDCTNIAGLDIAMASPITGYIGFDCTADSLHVGSLLPIMMLRWLQKTGHTPIVLMGGGTSKIGDPSGKDTSRQILNETDIAGNMAGIKSVFDSFLQFSGIHNSAIAENNADWLSDLNYIDFLRDFGQHFTVNRMLSFDSVKSRLDREQPMTFLEFNYMLFQAYDFTELHKKHKCMLQMGGSDQWGNILNGVDLTRRVTGDEVFGLVSPLLTKADGSKMGKTANGAVWLNADKCNEFDFWQFWRNIDDADVHRFLKLFTELPIPLCDELGSHPGEKINDAKIILANAVTSLLHGKPAAVLSEKTASGIFNGSKSLIDNLPTIVVSSDELAAGIKLSAILHRAGFVKSRKEGSRAISENGVKLNDGNVTDPQKKIDTASFDNGPIKLSFGKKKHVMIKMKETND